MSVSAGSHGLAWLVCMTGLAVAGEPEQAQLADRVCRAGQMPACHNLGMYYRDGRGVPRDEVKALALFLRACEAHVAGACGDRWMVAAEARGAGAAPEVAFRELSALCDGGDAMACANVGFLLTRGVGTPKVLRRACEHGEAIACRAVR